MRSTTRRPTSVRRREIAEATLRVIGERGASSLTTATLASEVGLTPGALFRHFASLNEILEATVTLAVERIEATFPSEDLPPIERLHELAGQRLKLFEGNPGLAWLLLSDQVYLTVPEKAVETLRNLVQRSRSFILRALREAAKTGCLRSDLSPEMALVFFTGTVHALIGARGAHRPPGSGRTAPPPAKVLRTLFALLGPTQSED